METSEPSKPRKWRWSWRQYSISTLLVAVTIVSVVLGVVRHRAEGQRRAAAAIHKLGGTVAYDFELNKEKPPGPAWLHQFLGVDYFAGVVLVQAWLTDETCSHLSPLRNLRWLFLYGSKISDAGLMHMGGLTKLQSLDLDDMQITDAGLAHVASLASLKQLFLRGTHVTDAGLTHLAGLTTMEELNLTETQITDAGLVHLTGLTGLKQLYLRHEDHGRGTFASAGAGKPAIASVGWDARHRRWPCTSNRAHDSAMALLGRH